MCDVTVASQDITKNGIRQKIWDYLESSNIAQFPRPVHHRIPNFKGAEAACDKAATLEVFKKAHVIKINPDKPQEHSRFLTLEGNKELLVPTPRLRTGLFNKIIPPAGRGKEGLRICATSKGVREYSTPLGLEAKVRVGLIVIGSVAVSPKGYRIGKGEGYADMEYAMMTTMGAIGPDTPVVTTVHDCQVIDDLPDHLFAAHDVPVDYIVTPTQIIRCQNLPKPTGINWAILTPQRLQEIPVLKILREKERKKGKDVKLRDEH